jgi:hypothetical protein
MPILGATAAELIVLAGVTAANFRADMKRGHSVLAFGGARPSGFGKYLAVDAVAMGIRDDLYDHGMSRGEAAWYTRNFWDTWALAGSRLEHHGVANLFVVGELDDGVEWCSAGPEHDLPTFLKNFPKSVRLFVVNLQAQLNEIRQRADRAGMDLSAGSFLPAPENPVFVQLLAEFRDRRERYLNKYDPLRRGSSGLVDVRGRRTLEVDACQIARA